MTAMFRETIEFMLFPLPASKENFFHVFARTGFTAAIHQIMANSLALERDFQLPDLYRSDCRNRDGNHPTMEAAKHNRCDALVLLLHPILQEATNLDEDRRRCLHELLHCRNRDGHTLLFLVSHHQKNLFLPHSMIMHLELQVHEGRHEEIQECIRTNLGSSKISKQTALVVKEKAPGVTARLLNFAEILLLIFLVPVAFFILDMVTDGLLVADYFSDMNNQTVSEQQDESLEFCRSNLTLSCYSQAMRAESKFTISLAIMLFPFSFYLVEVVKYFRLKPYKKAFATPEASWKRGSWIHRARYRTKKWYTNAHMICNHPISPISPLVLLEGFLVWLTWPIRIFLLNVVHKLRLESSHSHEKIDRHSKYQRAYQIYASRAHLIEVCAESSLQPLLQLYLFLPSLISSFLQIGLLPTIKLADLTSTASVQLISVLMSVLSVSYSFTTHYRRGKHEAMPVFNLGTLFYFAHTLCLVVSRLLGFVLFAYYFAPGEWAFAASAVLYHVVVMAVLHGIMLQRNPDKYLTSSSLSGGWLAEGFTLLYICTLNGLANIFVHNKIDDFVGHHNSQEQQQQQQQHSSPAASPGLWCLCRNTAPNISGPDIEEDQVDVGGGRTNVPERSNTTFFRQSFFDLIFACELVGMVYLGYRSRLRADDAEFAAAFRPLAMTSFALFALGIALKLVFYAAFHLWSDLIVSRAARHCACKCGDNNGGHEEVEMVPLRSGHEV